MLSKSCHQRELEGSKEDHYPVGKCIIQDFGIWPILDNKSQDVGFCSFNFDYSKFESVFNQFDLKITTVMQSSLHWCDDSGTMLILGLNEYSAEKIQIIYFKSIIWVNMLISVLMGKDHPQSVADWKIIHTYL